MRTKNLIHPGEILQEEFLAPLGISQTRLALDLHVPAPRINAIVRGKRAITADTALRLGQYFKMEPQFWLNLQANYDLCASTGAEYPRDRRLYIPWAESSRISFSSFRQPPFSMLSFRQHTSRCIRLQSSTTADFPYHRMIRLFIPSWKRPALQPALNRSPPRRPMPPRPAARAPLSGHSCARSQSRTPPVPDSR